MLREEISLFLGGESSQMLMWFSVERSTTEFGDHVFVLKMLAAFPA